MDDLLMLPGPTAVPPVSLKAQAQQMIGHREKEFSELLQNLTEKLNKVFRTDNDVLIFSGSGTAGLEIAVVNCFSAGDKILSISNGVFADRFREIASTFGLEVLTLDFPWGAPLDYEKITETLEKHKDLKGVLFTHNETSTGVQNDLEKMGKLMKGKEALLLVDAVSSLGGLKLETDKWGADIVITSSQKALMTPPGLAILSVGKKAWQYINESNIPRFFWDLKKAKKYYDQKKQTPYTPAVSLLYALDSGLNLILDEGLEQVFSRHKLLTKALRSGLLELGITPYVPWEIASYTVSSFNQISGLELDKFKGYLLEKFKLHITGGQKELNKKIFRIGHLGYVSSESIIKTINNIGLTLKHFGIIEDNVINKSLSETKKLLDKGVE